MPIYIFSNGAIATAAGACKDTVIDSIQPNVSFGSESLLSIGQVAGVGALLRQEIGAIPVGETVDSAVLSAFMSPDFAVDVTVNAYGLLTPWGVNNVSAGWSSFPGMAGPEEPTFDDSFAGAVMPPLLAIRWAGGGAFGVADFDSAHPMDPQVIPFGGPQVWFHWTVTPAVVAWHAGLVPNHGLFMGESAVSGGLVGMDSTTSMLPGTEWYLTVNTSSGGGDAEPQSESSSGLANANGCGI